MTRQQPLIRTVPGVRRAFWDDHPEFRRVPGRRQNDYNATIRTAWCNWVDAMARDGIISQAMAQFVTL